MSLNNFSNPLVVKILPFVFVMGLTGSGLGLGYEFAQRQGQEKRVPYLVEVDTLGNIVPRAFPAHIDHADERLVRALLSGFVSDFRSVTSDMKMQEGSIFWLLLWLLLAN